MGVMKLNVAIPRFSLREIKIPNEGRGTESLKQSFYFEVQQICNTSKMNNHILLSFVSSFLKLEYIRKIIVILYLSTVNLESRLDCGKVKSTENEQKYNFQISLEYLLLFLHFLILYVVFFSSFLRVLKVVSF